MSAAHCGNCGAKLLGPWCAQCGQPAHVSARGFGALLQDGWHTLTHLDGRFWRTFGALLLRPGHLTAEYFAGRRQRYLPPVRLYLVLSVLFFSLAGPGSPPTAGPVSATPPPGGAVEVEVGRCELRLGIGGLDGALQRGCQRVMQGDSRALSAALRDNIPRMMFVFLPLLAAVMLLLYWRPRRLYLEHLVFGLHNHAALFLAFILLACVLQLADWLPQLRALATAGIWAIGVYSPWYVWRALRRYYGQGRLLTFAKFALLGLAYLACLMLTLLGATLVSLLQA